MLSGVVEIFHDFSDSLVGSEIKKCKHHCSAIGKKERHHILKDTQKNTRRKNHHRRAKDEFSFQCATLLGMKNPAKSQIP